MQEVSQDINLYSSDDLASWVFEGVLVSQVTPLARNLALHACLHSINNSARLTLEQRRLLLAFELEVVNDANWDGGRAALRRTVSSE